MIERYEELIPDGLKDCSGSVFYSGRNAFTGTKDIYLLGLNPGGDPNAQEADSIRDHTRYVLERASDHWSAYSCESWRNRTPGNGGIQPRVIHLMRQLRLDHCDMPASNVVFVRTKDEKSLPRSRELADMCWPVHRAVIANAQPRLIVCMGRRAQQILRDKTQAITPLPHLSKSCRNSFLVEVFENARGCRLAVLKHPSRCDWRNPDSDPSETVRCALKGVRVRWSSQDVEPARKRGGWGG